MMVGLTLMKVSSCSINVSVPNTMTITPVTSAMIGTCRTTMNEAIIAATMATMKAPVATNRLNLALATKNTNSGPSSVASLNSGCGVFLFIRSLYSCDRLRKVACREWREILDAFADADEVYRQFVLFRQRHQDAAACGAVKLGHHKAGDARGTLECFDLRQRILPNGRIEHQQYRVRRRRIDLVDDADHLFQFVHQFGLVLQTAGGIDQQHVHSTLARGGQRVEGKACRVRTLPARYHRRFGAIAPDLQLLDRGGAESVARRQHHLAAFGGETRRELADGGGLA